MLFFFAINEATSRIVKIKNSEYSLIEEEHITDLIKIKIY